MYNSLQEHLTESQRVDESVTLLAYAILAFAAKPILSTFAEKAGEGAGSLFSGLASLFGLDKESRDKRRERKEEKRKEKEERRKEKEERRKEGKEDRAANDKAYNPKEHGLFSNVLELAKQKTTGKLNDKIIDLMQASSVDKDGNPVPMEKMGERMKELTGEDPKEVLKANGVKELTDEETKKVENHVKLKLEKMTPEQREEVAKKGLEESKKKSAEAQAYMNKTIELNKELIGAQQSNDKEKVEAVQKKIAEHQKNATGAARAIEDVKAQVKKNKKDDKADKPEPKKEPKGEDGEPAGTTAKEEEVVDKETGKKVKRKVYTGPQGGRYYYPDGKPHTAEHKVYVESLSEYLHRTVKLKI